MNRLVYNLLLHFFVAPFLAAYYLPGILVRGKYNRSISGKLGRLPDTFFPEKLSRPKIWFHAVSVGEVVALGPVVKSLKHMMPESSLIISTGTETGQDRARSTIGDADDFLYLPLDFPEFVNPVVRRICPDLFVLMETELWPNLIHCLKTNGAGIVLANGRISDRSFPRYRRLRKFFAPTLEKIDLFLMASETDASRIQEMGAASVRVHVAGNTKYDAIPGNTSPAVEFEMRRLLSIEPGTRVLVAGSTHPGEHELVLDAFLELSRRFSDLILVLVPRHTEKTAAIISAMADRGMEPPFLRSSADTGEMREGRKVVVVDRMGELFGIYSLASVVFMGGSLVPLGGQNILEPAAWGKIVLFGPSMEDFRDARDLLVRCGAGIQISSVRDLVSHVSDALLHPQDAAARGALGREAIMRNVGSAGKIAECLVELLGKSHNIER
ncbi:MAG TPA: 3-deoxy-D-manno-octulosonic acid transferase [Desulfomonilaceae bacterium]|nr:3-deoxy-D-manno-octulosonic acid transferase [Desulfomonilaceae bacterium]